MKRRLNDKFLVFARGDRHRPIDHLCNELLEVFSGPHRHLIHMARKELFPEKPFKDRFSLSVKVGSGTYGQVWLATRPNDPKQKLSVKQSRITNEDQSITSSIFRELVILSEVNYPHIIHISSKDIILDPEAHVLSFAYDYGAVDVRKMVTYYSSKKGIPMRQVVAKSILFQLLLALDYLHKRSIAHCDITPSNLLLMSPTAPDFPGIVKLIDFGLSRIIESSGTQRNYGIVTVWYRAPELLLGDTLYDQKVDIWAAGCIFGSFSPDRCYSRRSRKCLRTTRRPSTHRRSRRLSMSSGQSRTVTAPGNTSLR
jgi:serine/threonine protein kinase